MDNPEAKDPKWLRMTLALSENRIEFKGDVVHVMFAPVVYVVFGEAAVLYVGMSSQGLGRLFDRKHHVLTKEVWESAVSAQVFQVASVAAARTLEAELIQAFTPIHNDRQCWDHARCQGRKRGAARVIDHFAALG